MQPQTKNLTLLNKWYFVQKVVSDPKLGRCAVACAFHLVDYYNHRLGRAWPSYETLANLTGSHRRTVIEAVKRLIGFKYFEVEKGNGRRTNYYRPNFALMVKESAQAGTGDEDATSPVTQTPPLRGVEVKLSAPNTSYIPVAPSVGDIEVSPRSAGSSAVVAPSPSRGAPPGFKEFWQVYPKKEGRKAALTAYAMALQEEGVTPELLATKAAQYAEAKAANDPKWIKMPRTWLDDECWLEDPQAPKSKTAKGRPKRKTAKTTGEAKPTSKGKAKAKGGKKSKANGSSTSKRKANAAKTAPKQTKRRRSKRRAKSQKRQPTSFGCYVLRYCDYLGITPRDISLAMGLRQGRIEEACYGRGMLNSYKKDQVKSLLIEAVRHRPDYRPLTEEWLREWYGFMIKEEPPKLYKWLLPHRCASSGPNPPSRPVRPSETADIVIG